MANTYTLLVDDRERAVFDYLKANGVAFPETSYKITRLTVGDYAVFKNNKLILSIERKTWNDLAASIKDHRKENLQRLIDTRTQTGCYLAYIIEGKPFPASNVKIGRIPAKNLRSHLDHVAFRDNIYVVLTKDQNGTARRIFELIRNISTLENDTSVEENQLVISNVIGGGDGSANLITTNAKIDIELPNKEQEPFQEQSPNNSKNTMIAADTTIQSTKFELEIKEADIQSNSDDDVAKQPASGELEQSMPSGEHHRVITQKQKTPEIGVLYKMWSAIPSITEKTAKLFIQSGYKLSDLVLGHISADTVFNMRYTSGAVIGKKSKKILKIAFGTKEERFKLHVKILIVLQGVSRLCATNVLTECIKRMEQKCKIAAEQGKKPKHTDYTAMAAKYLYGEITVEELADINKTERMKVGPQLAKKILHFIRM